MSKTTRGAKSVKKTLKTNVSDFVKAEETYIASALIDQFRKIRDEWKASSMVSTVGTVGLFASAGMVTLASTKGAWDAYIEEWQKTAAREGSTAESVEAYGRRIDMLYQVVLLIAQVIVGVALFSLVTASFASGPTHVNGNTREKNGGFIATVVCVMLSSVLATLVQVSSPRFSPIVLTTTRFLMFTGVISLLVCTKETLSEGGAGSTEAGMLFSFVSLVFGYMLAFLFDAMVFVGAGVDKTPVFDVTTGAATSASATTEAAVTWFDEMDWIEWGYLAGKLILFGVTAFVVYNTSGVMGVSPVYGVIWYMLSVVIFFLFADASPVFSMFFSLFLVLTLHLGINGNMSLDRVRDLSTDTGVRVLGIIGVLFFLMSDPLSMAVTLSFIVFYMIIRSQREL